jgi:hypothetical protein
MKTLSIILLMSASLFAADKANQPEPLSFEDQEKVSRVIITLLNTRVLMLEALTESKMGIEHQKQYSAAQKQFESTITEIKKKYKASDDCGLNPVDKVWVCVNPKPADPK